MSKIVEMKQRGVRAKLREAHESGALVRLWRAEHEAASFTGFVVGMGKEFFLIWALGDYIGFDGIYALRHRDVSEIEVPDKNAGFLLKAMALKKIEPTWPKEFGLDDVEGVLRGAGGNAPVIAIHVDTEAEEEICYVGRLLGFEADGFLLQEITPDAEWLREQSFFGFEEVSAVAFHGPYHQALAEIAGVPPDDIRPFSRDQGSLH